MLSAIRSPDLLILAPGSLHPAIFDLKTAYIGSANLTGAGIGMKSAANRNFEAGILTNDPRLVAVAAEQFDGVWRGDFCAKCGRKEFCSDPIKRKF